MRFWWPPIISVKEVSISVRSLLLKDIVAHIVDNTGIQLEGIDSTTTNIVDYSSSFINADDTLVIQEGEQIPDKLRTGLDEICNGRDRDDAKVVQQSSMSAVDIELF